MQRNTRDAAALDPWVGRIPWRREWLPMLVFLPGEFHGQRRLVDYSPWGCKELVNFFTINLFIVIRG